MQLDVRERRLIEDLLTEKASLCKIAAYLDRHRSTIYREIKRNRFETTHCHSSGTVTPTSARGLLRPAE